MRTASSHSPSLTHFPDSFVRTAAPFDHEVFPDDLLFKIDRFAPATTSRVRLSALSSADPMRIREFQLSGTGKGAAKKR